MKRRKFILIGVVAATATMLNGCFNSGPGAAVENFMRSLEQGNLDEAMEFYPDSYSQTFGRDKVRTFMAEVSRELQAQQGIKSFKVNREDIQGDIATVNFTVVYGDGSEETEEMRLLKQDGKWRADPNTGK